MKSYTLKTNPRNFDANMAKAKALLSEKGDAEITFALAGGEYHPDAPVALDGQHFVGKKRLRFLGGGRVKTVFSSLISIPTARFLPVAAHILRTAGVRKNKE